MIKEDDTLRIKKGYVVLKNKENTPIHLSHAWLVDLDGNIIDPTARQLRQFYLGELQYVPANPEDMKYRCEGCGQYCKGKCCGT